ncbi:Mpp10 protein [Ceraceosorus guamensis]|uniref:Mpp10 protein n=1 Tax=Ceraceosorus guamensis TaxID=1522189 RepID=A0A316W281_9BASI|nr:Mpp10 protein [Ceraceosorus guamensis]PWN43789.1 Mpp10 protein [Ceraceosorus guamensis]
MTPFLHDNFPTEVARSTRAGKKRKRPTHASAHHPLFDPTPLESLTVQGMSSDQIWTQLELRGVKLEKLIKGIVSVEGGEVEEEEEEEEEEKPAGKPFKRSANRTEEEDEDDEGESAAGGRKIVHSLDELSDAELRALGVDPSMRSELQSYASHSDSESDKSSDSGEGYAGASDLSDLEESRDISYEPLLDEREQQKRKEALIMAEYARTRAQKKALKEAGMHVEDDSESDEEGEEDETDEEDENIDPELRQMLLANRRAAEEEDEEEERESEEEEDAKAKEERRRASILDNLDEPGSSVSNGRPRKSFPTLDDEFFSYAEFEKQLDEAERREARPEMSASRLKKGKDMDEEEDSASSEDDEDVDLFKDPGGFGGGAILEEMDVDDEGDARGQDASDIRYADFFKPPPYAKRISKSGGVGVKGKLKGTAQEEGKGAAASTFESAGSDQQDAENRDPKETLADLNSGAKTKKGPSVRFAQQVAVRRIKSRKMKEAVSPELLRMLMEGGLDKEEAQNASGEMDGAAQDEAEEEDGEDDGEDEEEGDSEDADEEDDEDDEDDDGDEEGMDMDDDGEGQDSGDEDRQDDRDMSVDGDAADDAGVQTARRVTGDLFADEPSEESCKYRLCFAISPASKQSTHERRMAALQEEIDMLEQENVGKRDWTLMGEASSKKRPENSLLEEDLEFESAGKAKPIITEEVTEGLEDLIKTRILENRFDDVVRKRNIEATPFLPSRLLELSDAKSAKSLAQLYEDEYAASRGDGESGASAPAADAKLQKEHEEIEQVFDEVCAKLDALSNAHYTPKAPKTSIRTIANTPTISIESALPSTSSAGTMLAPEEIYARAAHSASLSGDRSELTPEEAQRLHHNLRSEKKARNKRIADHQKALQINAAASGRRVPGSAPGGRGKKAERQEKDTALRGLLGNKGVSVVGKGKEAGAGKEGNAKGKGKRGGNATPPSSGATLKL